MGDVAVFAYGSLVSPASAAATLGRPITASPPVRLAGWQRRWSTARDNLASEKTFAPAGGGEPPAWCLGLNVESAEGEPGPNGVLLELTEPELQRLDLREMRYDRVEVTDAFEPAVRGGRRVVTYRAKPRHHRPKPPDGAVIVAAYARAVESAFAELGADQVDLYRASTDAPPVELLEAVLVRDRIPAGNPREW